MDKLALRTRGGRIAEFTTGWTPGVDGPHVSGPVVNESFHGSPAAEIPINGEKTLKKSMKLTTKG